VCSQCKGSGHISAYQLMWILSGYRLAELRGSLGLTMCQAADVAHTTVLAWNEAEHGRADPLGLLNLMRSEGATS
jgi:hypothetical protein